MDPYQFDQTQFVTDLVKDFSISVFDHANKLTSQQIKRLKTRFKIGFDDYLSETIASASIVKTILYRDFSENIGNIYVDQDFLNGNDLVTDSELRKNIIGGQRVIVSGFAGSGKSFFVKNLIYTTSIEKKKFPIFVEIRNVAAESNSILHHIINSVFSPNLTDFDKDDLDYALRSGLFFMVLDGLDEVTEDRRKIFLEEIEFITQRYPELGIVVTSRPDDSVESLPNFPVYRVQPLSLEKAQALIEALSFDDAVKEEFLPALSNYIYQQHFDFASNPLLLNMLLITFDQVGSIPERMHIFYSQAFEALVFKHDLLKSRYRRPQKSGLEINTLRKVYAHFCANTYLKKTLSFSDSDLLDKLTKSLKFAGSNALPSELAHDLITCFSMLKRDGLRVTFVHRSFQEYFCALHILNTPLKYPRKAIEHIAAAPKSEQAFSMLVDMSPEFVVREWALPFLIESAEFSGQCFKEGRFSLLASYLFRHFEVDDSGDEVIIKFGTTKTYNQLDSLEILAKNLEISELFENLNFPQMALSPESSKALTESLASLSDLKGKLISPSENDNAWLGTSPFVQFAEQLSMDLRSGKEIFSKVLSDSDDLDFLDELDDESNSKQEWFEANIAVFDKTGNVRFLTKRNARKIFDS